MRKCLLSFLPRRPIPQKATPTLLAVFPSLLQYRKCFVVIVLSLSWLTKPLPKSQFGVAYIPLPMMYARTEFLNAVLLVASFLIDGSQATHQARAVTLGTYLFSLPCSVWLDVSLYQSLQVQQQRLPFPSAPFLNPPAAHRQHLLGHTPVLNYHWCFKSQILVYPKSHLHLRQLLQRRHLPLQRHRDPLSPTLQPLPLLRLACVNVHPQTFPSPAKA